MNEVVFGAANAPEQNDGPRRSDAEAIAQGSANAEAVRQVETANAVAEDPEKRCADIKIWVEAECDYFGIEPKDDPVADQITSILRDHEAKQLDRGRGEYDVTQDQRRRLDRVIARGMEQDKREEVETEAHSTTAALTATAKAEGAETSQVKELTEAAETDVDKYRTLLGSEEYRTSSNSDKITIMINHPDVPESERGKWQSFARIMTIAKAVPQDAQIITTRLNQMDMSAGIPSPMQFIQSAIFSSPEHDSGVSDATQAAIAAEFSLTPHRVVTGSDFETAMGATKTDPQGNQVPAYPETEPLRFGVGLDGFTSDDGASEFMRATPTHGQGVTVDVTRLSANDKAILASYLDTWRMTEDAGETEFLLSLTQYDIRGQSIIDPVKLIEAQQVVNAVYGGFAGYNGEVLRGDHNIGMIRWQAQLRTPKGDAARSDRNASMTDDALRGLGIRDDQGHIDLDMLRAFGSYSRDNWFGAPNYVDVRDHLAELFPQKFETA